MTLIDTGAQISVLPKNLYDAIPVNVRPALRDSKVMIKAGNGTVIQCHGVATVSIEFQGMSFDQEFHVVEDTVQPILGYDFLHEGKDTVLRPSSHSVEINGKKLKLVDPDAKKVSHKVSLNQTITISKGQEVNVDARVRGKNDIEGRNSMMEPAGILFPKTGALICKLVVTPRRNTVPVRIFNPHDEPIRLYKGTTLGILREINTTVPFCDPKQQRDANDEVIVTSDARQKSTTDDVTVTSEQDEPLLTPNEDTDADESTTSSSTRTSLSNDSQACGYDEGEECEDLDDHDVRNYNSVDEKSEVKENAKIRAYATLPTNADGSIDYEKVPKHLEDLYNTSLAELNSNEQLSLKKLLIDYQDIFAKNSQDIGKAVNVKHHIDTGNEDPVAQRPRRQAKVHTDEIQQQIKKLHDAGVIRPSESEWASNVVMARKKDGTWRMCIDYRELNLKTKNKGTYMLPRIDDTLDSLSRAKYFCSLDVIQGYHHIELSEESKCKTAFHAPKCNPSHWEYNFMPFGLVGAPRTFQRMMDRILRGLEYKIALAYLDDIIIYGATIDECMTNMRIVFERIRQAGLKLKPSKCQFFARETTFLGHVISADGVKTEPKKVHDVVRMKPCRNLKDIQTFLGMTQYYSKFIPNFQEIVAPLSKLLKKNTKFQWSYEQHMAFETLKKKLVSAPILAYPRDDCKYILDTDASNYALGAVLSQLQPNENGELVERPIAYYSKRFNGAELCYCARRRELLAIIRSVKQFDPYIRGQPFTIRTDHASLKYIKTVKELPSQFQRWVLQMEEYDYNIEIRKGTLHANADGMSRMPCEPCNGKQCICLGVDDLEKSGDCDDYGVAHAVVNAIRYSPKYTDEEMAQAQRADPDVGPLYRAKVDDKKRPSWNEISGESPAAKAYMAEWRRVEVHNDIIYRRWENDDGSEQHLQLIIPFKYQRELCRQYHDSSSKAHLGRRRCYAAIQRRYFWHKMNDDVRWWIRTCDVCQRRKRPQPTPKAPMRIYVTGYPNERVSMDVVGPIELTDRNNQYLLCMTDHFSKFAKAVPLPNHTAKTVAETFTTQWCEEYGEPMQVHTDQGAEFESKIMKELCAKMDIEKTRTVAFKPSSDGLVERYNKTVIDCISMLRKKTKHWDLVVGKCVSAYNSTIHATTGFTPNKLWFGREIFHSSDLMMPKPTTSDDVTREQYVKLWEADVRLAYEVAREKIGRNVKIQKKYYDRSSHLIAYKEGDAVMLKDYTPKIRGEKKLADKWDGPLYILDVLSDVNFRVIRSPTHKPKVVHHDRLKRYHHRDDKPDVSWILNRSKSYKQLIDDVTTVQDSENVSGGSEAAAACTPGVNAGPGRQQQGENGPLATSNPAGASAAPPTSSESTQVTAVPPLKTPRRGRGRPKKEKSTATSSSDGAAAENQQPTDKKSARKKKAKSTATSTLAGKAAQKSEATVERRRSARKSRQTSPLALAPQVVNDGPPSTKRKENINLSPVSGKKKKKGVRGRPPRNRLD